MNQLQCELHLVGNVATDDKEILFIFDLRVTLSLNLSPYQVCSIIQVFCCTWTIFILFIIVCTCCIIFNTLCLLCSRLLSGSSSLLLDRPSFPSGINKLLSNPIFSLQPCTALLLFLLLLCLLLLLLLPPLPSCLSVSRRRGDSKSPRRKPIRLGESARQSGRGFLIWIYLRNSAKQSLTCFQRPALFLIHHLHLLLLHRHHHRHRRTTSL